MSYFGYSAIAAVGGAVIYANLPTRFTIGAVAPSFAHLSDARLIPIRGDASEMEKIEKSEAITAASLFEKGPIMVMAVRRPGCLLCRREAAQLNTLKPLLEKNGIRLVAVVHEIRGANEFKNYFDNDIYLDTKRTFYGPNERWLPVWMGFLRIGTYMNVFKAKKARIDGNFKGEGRLLGGVYLVAKNEIVYAHLEKEWGDAANIDEVSAAIHKFSKSNI